MGGYTVLETNMGDTDRGTLGFEWSVGHTQVGRWAQQAGVVRGVTLSVVSGAMVSTGRQ